LNIGNIDTSSTTKSDYKDNNYFKNLHKKFKEIFWPIGPQEVKKFLCIASLLFCILFIQNVIRALKDGIISTHVGAETIAFLKFWGVLPATFLIIGIYVKIIHKFSSEKIFYGTMTFFITFFAVFTFILYPNHEIFHYSPKVTQNLIIQMPYFKWFIVLLTNWSFSLFYIVAEMWPNTVLSLLTWQFINAITSVEQSKRFYILFGLISQTGLIFSGLLLTNAKNLSATVASIIPLNPNTEVIYIQLLLSIVILLGLIAMFIFWYLNNVVIQNNAEQFVIKTKIKKTTLLENVKFIWYSKYIRLITLLLICYGASINLVEAPWKIKTSSVYTTVADFTSFSGEYLKYTGICTLIMVLLGSNIVRKLGWATTAIITPAIITITGILVFASNTFHHHFATAILIIDPINFAIIAGAVQNVMSKSSKYALFDATKEMVYVPLDDETKAKGKAAADMLGVKFGKSFSAGIQAFLLIIFPNVAYNIIASYLMIIFLLVCALWFFTIYQLNKEYLLKLETRNDI